jgi:hypothetical protein
LINMRLWEDIKPMAVWRCMNIGVFAIHTSLIGKLWYMDLQWVSMAISFRLHIVVYNGGFFRSIYLHRHTAMGLISSHKRIRLVCIANTPMFIFIKKKIMVLQNKIIKILCTVCSSC